MGAIVTIDRPAELVTRDALADVLGVWLADLDDTTADTRATYGRLAGRFFDWHQADGGGPVTGARVRRWLASIGGAPATRNLHLAALRSFCRWAVRSGHLPADPTDGVTGARHRGAKQHKRDAFTPAEVAAMLDACARDDRPAGARDGAVLGLMAYMALRTVEVERADLADLGTARGRRVLWIHGKGAADAPTPGVVTDACWRVLARWLDVRGDAPGPLITTLDGPKGPAGGRLARRTIRAIIDGRKADAGILPDAGRRVTAHSLRHAAVTRVLTAGGTLRQAQSLARHANLATTQVYLHELDRYADAPEDRVTW